MEVADNGEVAENVIPENSAEFGKQVDSMLYEKLSRFARSRSLQLSMPQMFDEGRDLDDGVYLTGNITFFWKFVAHLPTNVRVCLLTRFYESL